MCTRNIRCQKLELIANLRYPSKTTHRRSTLIIKLTISLCFELRSHRILEKVKIAFSKCVHGDRGRKEAVEISHAAELCSNLTMLLGQSTLPNSNLQDHGFISYMLRSTIKKVKLGTQAGTGNRSS